jgi:hypothetical protein
MQHHGANLIHPGNRRPSDGIAVLVAFTPEISMNMLAPTLRWSLTMIRFMFLVPERHRVVAPTSARPLVIPVPAL